MIPDLACQCETDRKRGYDVPYNYGWDYERSGTRRLLYLDGLAPYSRLRTAEDEVPLDTRTMALHEEEEYAFDAGKKGKVEAQPQLYGTSYLFVTYLDFTAKMSTDYVVDMFRNS